MSSLVPVVSIFAVGYAVVALALFIFQPNLLYLPDIPSREIVVTPRDIGLDYESLTLATDDDEKLAAWFIPAGQARGTVLFCHGNAGNISHRLDSIRIFHRLGLSVLIFDYRGYGRSTGKPSEQGTYRDATAAWNYLAGERGIPPERIILFGRSLGAAVAAELATREPAAGVILESAFTSVPDVAAQLYSWLPVRWLSRFRYDTLARIADIHAPLLIVHSRNDEIIAFSNGERLFEAAGEPKRFLELQGGHNDGFIVSGAAYREGLEEFLDDVLPDDRVIRGAAAQSG